MTAGRLVFHIGSLKTGTTAIQAALDRDRARLAAHGIHYPATTPEFSPTRSAHHRVAHAVADLGLRNRIGLTLFFRRLRRQAADYRLTLLSAEPVYRHVAFRPPPRESDAWFEGRAVYLNRLRNYLRDFDTQILLYLRRPHDYAVSLYKEALTKTRSTRMPAFADMVEDYAPHFEYPRHLALLKERFGKVEVRGYEVEAAKGLVPAFYARLGLEAPPAEGRRMRVSVSNRAVAWLSARSGEGSPPEQRRRIFYAARDPDAIFHEAEPSTLWPSEDVFERFGARHAQTYDMEIMGAPPDFSGRPCIWTRQMQTEADARFLDWRAENLAMLKAREAKGLRHFHD
ncbi:MAG: hypothetical protein AAF982_06380 [Pseudomonadota bacterium]